MSHDAAVPRRRRRHADRLTATPLGARIPMLVILVYFFIPLLWLAISATKSNSDLFATFGFFFSGRFNLIDNLVDTFTHDDGIFLRWLGNTILYAGVSALVASLLAAAAGYAIARLRFFGRRTYFAVVLCTIMVPVTALTIPTYLMLSKVGLINTPLAIILPSIVSPFGLYLMTVYAQQAIPDGLLEAARIDGAGEYRIFWGIALPQLVPGFVTVLLLTLVSTWNNYFLPLIMLSDTQWFPITVGLATWNSQAAAGNTSEALFSIVITGALVSIVPLVIAFLLLQRYWQSGLSAGAIKS